MITVVLFDWITVILSIVFIIWKLSVLAKLTPGVFVYFIFFGLYVFPIFLDVFYMPPDYTEVNQIGFQIANSDYLTRSVYDCFVLLSQVSILYYLGRNSDKTRHSSFNTIKEKTNNLVDVPVFSDASFDTTFDMLVNKKILVLIVIGMVLPSVLVCFFGLPLFTLYMPFWREMDYSLFFANAHYVDKASYVGVFCCVFLFFMKSKQKGFSIFIKCLSLVFAYINVCIEGKRAVLFWFLIMFVVCFYGKSTHKKMSVKKFRRFFQVICLALIMCFIGIRVTTIVKINRGYNENNLERLYATSRIDFFRDDRIRLSFFPLLHNGELNTLERPCQTLPSGLCNIIWPVNAIVAFFTHYQPPKFTLYVSCACKNIPIDSGQSFMTPSISEEFIANFGWFGVLLSIFLDLSIIRLSENKKFPSNVLPVIPYLAIHMFGLDYMGILIEYAVVLYLCFTKLSSCPSSLKTG